MTSDEWLILGLRISLIVLLCQCPGTSDYKSYFTTSNFLSTQVNVRGRHPSIWGGSDLINIDHNFQYINGQCCKYKQKKADAARPSDVSKPRSCTFCDPVCFVQRVHLNKCKMTSCYCGHLVLVWHLRWRWHINLDVTTTWNPALMWGFWHLHMQHVLILSGISLFCKGKKKQDVQEYCGIAWCLKRSSIGLIQIIFPYLKKAQDPYIYKTS